MKHGVCISTPIVENSWFYLAIFYTVLAYLWRKNVLLINKKIRTEYCKNI